MEAIDTLREKGVKRIGPYRVTRTMGSTVSACLATPFQIKGVNYSISSACATSAHCIGQAMEQIQLGKQDVVRRRRRRGTLEPELPVRRHGRPLHPVQRDAGKGLPRLRRQA